jgi:hypothetical protein
LVTLDNGWDALSLANASGGVLREVAAGEGAGVMPAPLGFSAGLASLAAGAGLSPGSTIFTIGCGSSTIVAASSFVAKRDVLRTLVATSSSGAAGFEATTLAGAATGAAALDAATIGSADSGSTVAALALGVLGFGSADRGSTVAALGVLGFVPVDTWVGFDATSGFEVPIVIGRLGSHAESTSFGTALAPESFCVPAPLLALAVATPGNPPAGPRVLDPGGPASGPERSARFGVAPAACVAVGICTVIGLRRGAAGTGPVSMRNGLDFSELGGTNAGAFGSRELAGTCTTGICAVIGLPGLATGASGGDFFAIAATCTTFGGCVLIAFVRAFAIGELFIASTLNGIAS